MPDRHGPLRTKRFEVALDGLQIPGFQRIDLPKNSTQRVKYREGTDAAHDRKLWGGTQYEDVVLERGANAKNQELYDWRKKVEQGKLEEARKTLTIKLMDETGAAHLQWEFKKAWPISYDPPTLNANGGQGPEGIAVETYVVTYDEMNRRNI